MRTQAVVLRADAGPAGDVARPVEFDQRAQQRPEDDQPICDAIEEADAIPTASSEDGHRCPLRPVDLVQERTTRVPTTWRSGIG